MLSPGIKEIIKSFNAECDTYKTFLQLTYQGIVIKKYIDSSEHSFHTVEIKNFKDSAIQKLTLDFVKTDFVWQINPGDSIYKNRNSDTVYLFNKGSKRLYSLNFGCNQKS